jgi:hypothetical protein
MQVFLGNFSVYGSKRDHLGQLQKCLEKCRWNGISLNLEKCAFYVNSGVLLGHIIYSDGLLVDPIKITTITTMLILVSVTDIKRFLRLASFYQRYFWDLLAKWHPCANYWRKTKNSNGPKLAINLGSGWKHLWHVCQY